ncbi:hypothetical protein KR009_006808 [Drosophila setifemur]|nr:hypothetical protein KR009_006808 [Drosophila setifemur]
MPPTTVGILQIPPLNQKRILAFVNHFLVNTCNFLNEFALGCETKFVEMERQLQKTEAALIILEAKLASIPTEHHIEDVNKNIEPILKSKANEKQAAQPEERPAQLIEEEVPPEPPAGVRACKDLRYIKFFKMLHVGVPAPAIKQKMKSEGLEPQILE